MGPLLKIYMKVSLEEKMRGGADQELSWDGVEEGGGEDGEATAF